MRNLTRLITVSTTPAFIILTFRHATTHPYLDAGTGSIIIQALIAGSLGALVALKIFWSRIKTFFKNLFNRGKIDEESGD